MHTRLLQGERWNGSSRQAGWWCGSSGDVKYVYTRRGGVRVFKVVSFFLLRAGRGRIGAIEERMKIEVAEARWLPLDEAPALLAYGGEREMAAKARAMVGA